ncbi:MAG TPA: MBL fold metallo-hydrolase [Firmicutes bacterium]|nr:MBL fold metallo-hydrolase [Bacillota bacterium]
MKLTFIGAAHEVTGSCSLIELGGKFIMVDCGMEQGQNEFENVPLPVSPSLIECVFLTHAHIDHSGLLPLLYKNGFSGPIYATEATCNLCRIMLRDSAHIQESDAEWKSRKAMRSGHAAVEPLYTIDDAEGAIAKLRPVPYGQQIQVMESVFVRFSDIGHLLGSSCVELWLTENGETKKIVFSGDVGNSHQPIINDPKPVDEADYVVIESTYGDRLHGTEQHDYVTELARDIQDAFDRGGNLVIPSFAVGRTQEMLYFIREIKDRGLVHGHDGFKVYVDSPLAIEATSIFLQCDRSCFDPEATALLDAGINPLVFDGLELSVSSEDSKAINFNSEPKVIIAASGMCEAGRIRHHLKHNLWRHDSIILFVGYQAVGTLGRAIYDGAESVKLFGEEIAVNAEIRYLAGKSGHADRDGLLNWINSFETRPGTVFVNHGESASCENFAELLRGEGYAKVYAPYSGMEYDLAADAMLHEAEPIPAKKAGAAPKLTKSQMLLRTLLAAVQRLGDIARGFEGRPNREIRDFTSDVEKLCKKWKNK